MNQTEGHGVVGEMNCWRDADAEPVYLLEIQLHSDWKPVFAGFHRAGVLEF